MTLNSKISLYFGPVDKQPPASLVYEAARRCKLDVSVASRRKVQLSILDDFEQHLLHADSPLLRYADELKVDTPKADLHATQLQPVHFTSDIESDDIRRVVSEHIDPLRRLDPIWQQEIELQEFNLTDSERRTRIRGCLIDGIESETGSGFVVSLQPLTGYQKDSKKLSRLLNSECDLTHGKNTTNALLKLSGFAPTDYSLRPSLKSTASTPAHTAVLESATNLLRMARRNEVGVMTRADDTEYLHDYRICLRKVRALVSLLGNVFTQDVKSLLKDELAALMKRTNRLRDLDVYLLNRKQLSGLLPLSLQTGLPAMFDDFAAEQQSEHSSLCKWLRSNTYQQRLDLLERKLNALYTEKPQGIGVTPIVSLVNTRVQKRYRKVLKIGAQITSTTPDEKVHSLRIECKKLRYLMEFFAPLYDQKVMDKLVKRLKKLQNTLGDFNDYGVQQAFLADYLDKGDHSAQVHRSAGALILALSQKQQDQRSRVEEVFAAFSSRKTTDLINTLFAPTAQEKTQ